MMKREICVLSLLLLMMLKVSAEQDVFKLDWVTDGLIAGNIAAVNGAGFLMEDKEIAVKPGLLSVEEINSFDRWSAFSYSKPIDITSDILQYTSFLLPAVLFTTDKDQWLTVGVMYAESALLSYGLKNLGKALVTRYRPYNYFEGAPVHEDNDFLKSFPSGHTTMAFTGASFASYTFSQYFPDSPWKIPVIAGSYVLAGATAALRIASGNHFFSDVLAGAVIGSLSGWIIPYVHRVEKKINKSLSNNSSIEYKFAINSSYCSLLMQF